MIDLRTMVFAAGAGLALMTGLAGAAEIKVLSTQATEEAYRELVPQFEQATGHKVTTVFTGTLDANKRLAAGESLRPRSSCPGRRSTSIIKRGKVVPGSRVDLAKSGVGVGVQGRRAEARHQLRRRAEEDAARRQIDRLLHRPERRLRRRAVPAAGHRRRDQGQAQADPDRRVRRQHHRQRRGRDRLPAGERAAPSSPASTMSARCRRTSSNSPCSSSGIMPARRSRTPPRRWSSSSPRQRPPPPSGSGAWSRAERPARVGSSSGRDPRNRFAGRTKDWRLLALARPAVLARPPCAQAQAPDPSCSTARSSPSTTASRSRRRSRSAPAASSRWAPPPRSRRSRRPRPAASTSPAAPSFPA